MCPAARRNWTFNGGTNYNNQSGTAAIVINKADATVMVNGYTGIYDAAAHGATGSAHGVNGVDLSGSSESGRHLHGRARRHGALDLQRRHQLQQPEWHAAIVINKADATITVTPYSVTYNAVAHTATGTATGVLGESLAGLDLSGTTHTNAGNYTDNVDLYGCHWQLQ